MKLIVGLGNPGRDYENTRHNIGFKIIDNYASINGLVFSKNKFDGLYIDFIKNGEKVILLKPQSYMNLSGEVVSKFINFFKIDISDILIISDDLDMNFGRLRLKMSGSCGGHNGLRNIEKLIGTSMYKRLKFGIENNKNIDTKDYVLGKLSKEEISKLDELLPITVNLLNDFLSLDFDVVMNRYNQVR